MAFEVRSEMAGIVDAIEKGVGDSVSEGDEVIILSSMKMEIPVEAPVAGRIAVMHVEVGQTIGEQHLLFSVET
ncbi:MAG: acetyl-CoA carboxylase biotin carboxyl carrier protein subunit [Pararhodobacter sp.]|nr:acetyl-CoA carboxylase biotin carboxyl carrier protein subunit [Pararhodobacter sp.]